MRNRSGGSSTSASPSMPAATGPVGVDLEGRRRPLAPRALQRAAALAAPGGRADDGDPEQAVVDPRARARADRAAEPVAVVGDQHRGTRAVLVPARPGPAQVELARRRGRARRARCRAACAAWRRGSPSRCTASAYRPSETLLTNTRPLTSARSTPRSPPSTNASSAPTTSSRSTPRSSAKWLRVPAGTQAYGSPRSAAIAATIACEPSPPAIASAVGAALDRAADERLEVVAGASARSARSRARAPRSASAKRSAFPPPERRVEEQHRPAAGPARPAGRRGRRACARAAASVDQQPRDHEQVDERRPARDQQRPRRRRAPGAATASPATRATPRRSTPYQAAAPATSTQPSRPRPRGNSLTATATASTIVAAPTTSATIAASRRRISAPHDAREWAALTGPYRLGVIASGRSRLWPT